MPYMSNREIREAPEGYKPAQVLDNGNVIGPRCCGSQMIDAGGCSEGCCDDYICGSCGHQVRIEWPD